MNVDCNFIQDLLPLYAENLASESTRKLIDEHLDSCVQCKETLQTMQEKQTVPIRTDSPMLEDYNARCMKRSVLAVLLVVLLLFTVGECLLICYTVPVWLTAEESVSQVTELGGGAVNLAWKENVNIAAQFYTGNSVFVSGMRWPEENESNQGKMNTQPVDSSLWYAGELAGKEDTLLWGDNSKAPEEIQCNNTLLYLFSITECAGLVCLAAAAIMRKGKVTLIRLAIMLLCCAASCWFVTAGRFAIPTMYDRAQEIAGKPGMLTERLIHTAVLAVLSCGAIVTAWEWVKIWMPGRRRNFYGD